MRLTAGATSPLLQQSWSAIGLIALEVATGVAFASVVLTTFFRGVPRELEDTARIDGAHSAQVLRHVILPLSGPGIAAVTVFQSVFV
jgi:ABC-type glycerol-3-phosphate transport system permease component